MRGSGAAAQILAGLLLIGVPAGIGAAGGPCCDFVFTQLPASEAPRFHPGEPRTWGDRGRILRFSAGAVRNLTPDFHSAADPEVSFDGSKVLFAGKRTASEAWNIFEMDAEGSNVRQITRGSTDCRSPIYQSSIFYLDDTGPAAQVAYVSEATGEGIENGSGVAAAIYSVRMDGSGVRRLTYNPAGAFDPAMLPDGRMVFTSGSPGRMALFGVNIDGTDYAAFAGSQGRALQTMPAVTAKRQVVFVEPAAAARDGAGALSVIDLRRNLHWYRRVTLPAGGLFHSPSPLPDGALLVARRVPAPGGTFGIYRLDPATGRLTKLFAAAGTHAIQPKALAAREVPDGRSSVVDEKTDWAKLYCLNLYDSDLAPRVWPRGSVKRIRIVEGVPAKAAASKEGPPPVFQTRLIGEAPVDEDGSFNVQIPANIPVRIQALDAGGMALRSSSWFWAKNKEHRGCIGCHEDGERTPENMMASALTRPSANLMLAAERRRTSDFGRDIEPILRQKCASACHAGRAAALVAGRYVTPGQARTSPLVWTLFGRNTSRPWDAAARAAIVKPMPPAGSPPLTDSERRAIVEWIDLGAQGAVTGGVK